MYLALTYDHRLLDGREAVVFLVKVSLCGASLNKGDLLSRLQVKEYIEDPRRMLLGWASPKTSPCINTWCPPSSVHNNNELEPQEHQRIRSHSIPIALTSCKADYVSLAWFCIGWWKIVTALLPVLENDFRHSTTLKHTFDLSNSTSTRTCRTQSHSSPSIGWSSFQSRCRQS